MNSISSESNLVNSITGLRNNYSSQLYNLNPGNILIVILPNRSGKTYTTLEHLASMQGKFLYLSDRHNQMEEVEGTCNFIHWYGLAKMCENKDDPFFASMINKGLRSNVICRFCNKNKSCAYHKQFEVPDNTIVFAPKEFLPTYYIQNKNYWDTVVFDENIEKARKIVKTYPEISKDVFEEYKVNYDTYQSIGELIEHPSPLSSEDIEIINSIENKLYMVTKKISKKYSDFKPNSEEISLINFLNNLSDTINWINYAAKSGPLEHFYKPYLHYSLDLVTQKDAKLIILNTSLKKWIYEKLTQKYNHELPKPIYHTDYIENKESLLLNYVYNQRSCSKNKITEENGERIGGKYGNEIFNMVKKAVSFGYNKNLTIGIISYKSLIDYLKEEFGDKIEVYGYFGGHQGSNKFDQVDMLIVLGTYNINPKSLYQKHYIITGEYLRDNHAEFGNREVINGKQVLLSNNEDFNRIKIYKLDEEHEQAIFRSGANVKTNKIVVNFAHAPEGLEKKLNYRRFLSSNQLIGILGRQKIEKKAIFEHN